MTERNARDVAKKAEQLPDPAPAAKLTVAAGHMERAIVHLNEEKLADAYQPAAGRGAGGTDRSEEGRR